ncbi:MAG: hypothetical protein V7651_17125, partial [Hyphomonas oceanitis]|uniref:hypothetical protein n=1 Tax=Hyphomonas oceanitis TaxID=81033 RepID=UPI003003016D
HGSSLSRKGASGKPGAVQIIRRSEVNVILLGCTELTYFADRLRERGFVVLDSTMIHIQSLEINSAERAGG